MKNINLILFLSIVFWSCQNKLPQKQYLRESRDLQSLSEKFPKLKPVKNQWSKEKVNNWYNELPWLVGCNYIPATAINQIEMWQASTFDMETIDKELGWAESIGMNTLRVYLHDLVWEENPEGLYERMDVFLEICKKHGIRPFFVFFDDCHYENPKLGKQPMPVKAWHNSGWKNCPARDVSLRFADGTASDEEEARLKGYVQETIRRFKDDHRVLFWELYNEPGAGSIETGFKNADRYDKSSKLVQTSWEWAREVNPSQPISSNTEGSKGDENIYINRINSDIHSLHNYQDVKDIEDMISAYQIDKRPIIVTEWLARTRGSLVDSILPVLKRHRIGAINWGLVSGKTGTIWPWTSKKDSNGVQLNMIEKRNAGEVLIEGEPFPEPEVWFHDLFRTDGTPYDENEIRIFKLLTKKE